MHKAIFFDFYRTLSPSDYFRHLNQDQQTNISKLVFSEASTHYWEWLRGEIRANDIAKLIGENLSLTTEEVLSHFDFGCRRVELSPVLTDFAKSQRAAGVPVAIVTLNFDVFSEIIVPHLNLSERFDVIINSADFGSSDKRELFLEAMQRLGLGDDATDCLLIDDDSRWIEVFEDLGGKTKHFIGDEDFTEWLAQTTV